MSWTCILRERFIFLLADNYENVSLGLITARLVFSSLRCCGTTWPTLSTHCRHSDRRWACLIWKAQHWLLSTADGCWRRRQAHCCAFHTLSLRHQNPDWASKKLVCQCWKLIHQNNKTTLCRQNRWGRQYPAHSVLGAMVLCRLHSQLLETLKAFPGALFSFLPVVLTVHICELALSRQAVFPVC